MPAVPQHPQLPPEPTSTDGLVRWAVSFQRAFQRLWTTTVYVLNALSKVDTLANRTATPDIDETFFIASDTYQQYVGIGGTWAAVGRVGGTVMGAIPFTEISDPAAPAANGARLYVRDNGAGKSQIVCVFSTGAVQVIATEP